MTASPLDIRHGKLVVDDPYTLGTACEVALATDAEIDKTLDRARRAAKAWRHTQVKQRVALVSHFVAAMEKRKDEIAADLAATMGKPLAQGRNEVAGMAFRAKAMCEMAEAG